MYRSIFQYKIPPTLSVKELAKPSYLGRQFFPSLSCPAQMLADKLPVFKFCISYVVCTSDFGHLGCLLGKSQKFQTAGVIKKTLLITSANLKYFINL